MSDSGNSTDIHIYSVINKTGGAFMPELCEGAPSSPDNVAREVAIMVRQGILRQKEDEVEHDWLYELGPTYNAIFKGIDA